MMTLKRNIEENQDYLEEGLNLRSVSGIVLVGKIQTTNKQLKSIKLVKEDGTMDPTKLQRKLDLLSDQNLFLSVLTGSLQLLSKGKGRRCSGLTNCSGSLILDMFQVAFTTLKRQN